MSPLMAAAGAAWLVSAATGVSAFLPHAAVKAARPRAIVSRACFMVFSFMKSEVEVWACSSAAGAEDRPQEVRTWTGEVGRAAYREGVCNYVSITGGAWS